MAIVVSCPECQRKLKIAPTSIGKSVKCPCGNVFKAQEVNEPPLAMATPVAPTTLVVACDTCQAKLKVPASARGRKMKCSKCGATFVVPAEEAPAASPEWSKPTPPAFDDDDEPAEEPGAAKESAPSSSPLFEDAEADEPAPARKSASARPPFIEDEEPVVDVEPPPARAKGKTPARVAAATKPAASKTPAPASGCGGCVLSIFVLLIVIAYFAVFVPLYFFRTEIAEFVELPFKKPPPDAARLPRVAPQPKVDGDKKDDGMDKENEKKDDGPKKGKPVDQDKEKKEKPVDNDKKDNDDKAAASDRDGVPLLEVPTPVIAASPALDIGRPAKPVTRIRATRRSAAD
jgi:hypothetical protein